MISPQSNTDNLDVTMQALERSRKRIRFALNMAENGFLDFDTVDEICRSLSLALKDLDEVNLAAAYERRAA